MEEGNSNPPIKSGKEEETPEDKKERKEKKRKERKEEFDRNKAREAAEKEKIEDEENEKILTEKRARLEAIREKNENKNKEGQWLEGVLKEARDLRGQEKKENRKEILKEKKRKLKEIIDKKNEQEDGMMGDDSDDLDSDDEYKARRRLNNMWYRKHKDIEIAAGTRVALTPEQRLEKKRVKKEHLLSIINRRTDRLDASRERHRESTEKERRDRKKFKKEARDHLQETDRNAWEIKNKIKESRHHVEDKAELKMQIIREKERKKVDKVRARVAEEKPIRDEIKKANQEKLISERQAGIILDNGESAYRRIRDKNDKKERDRVGMGANDFIDWLQERRNPKNPLFEPKKKEVASTPIKIRPRNASNKPLKSERRGETLDNYVNRKDAQYKAGKIPKKGEKNLKLPESVEKVRIGKKRAREDTPGNYVDIDFNSREKKFKEDADTHHISESERMQKNKLSFRNGYDIRYAKPFEKLETGSRLNRYKKTQEGKFLVANKRISNRVARGTDKEGKLLHKDYDTSESNEPVRIKRLRGDQVLNLDDRNKKLKSAHTRFRPPTKLHPEGGSGYRRAKDSFEASKGVPVIQKPIFKYPEVPNPNPKPNPFENNAKSKELLSKAKKNVAKFKELNGPYNPNLNKVPVKRAIQGPGKIQKYYHQTPLKIRNELVLNYNYERKKADLNKLKDTARRDSVSGRGQGRDANRGPKLKKHEPILYFDNKIKKAKQKEIDRLNKNIDIRNGIFGKVQNEATMLKRKTKYNAKLKPKPTTKKTTPTKYKRPAKQTGMMEVA